MKYEINKDTFAILPLENNKSRIIEKNNEYIIDDDPYSVMEHSCSYFGSSLSKANPILEAEVKIVLSIQYSVWLCICP